MAHETRPLTQAEVEAFPGNNHVDVAMLSTDGVWCYAETTEEGAMFVADEGGDYIPV